MIKKQISYLLLALFWSLLTVGQSQYKGKYKNFNQDEQSLDIIVNKNGTFKMKYSDCTTLIEKNGVWKAKMDTLFFLCLQPNNESEKNTYSDTLSFKYFKDTLMPIKKINFFHFKVKK